MICKLRKYFYIYINCVWAYVPVGKDINQHNAGWKECKQYDENEGQERVWRDQTTHEDNWIVRFS